jgi:hypothetical protein
VKQFSLQVITQVNFVPLPVPTVAAQVENVLEELTIRPALIAINATPACTAKQSAPTS